MKNSSLVLMMVSIFLLAFSSGSKLQSVKSHIAFYSHTPLEDIKADNYTAISTFDTESGAVIFSVPMQGFMFEKALMQKHFNSANFLDTKAFPKAKFKGNVVQIEKVDLKKDGVYPVTVAGELTLKEVTKPVKTMGELKVKAGQLSVSAKFPITLADYGIVFEKGKPASNIAKTVEVEVHASYDALKD
jgi:polyisoprenoid-binding protein YceI